MSQVGARARSRARLTPVVLFAVGALFGVFGTMTWSIRPTARVVTGVVQQVDPTGSVVIVDGVDGLEDTVLGIVGAQWRVAHNSGNPTAWQRGRGDGGFPTCLEPDDVGRQVRLGIVRDPGAPERPPLDVVVWVECQGQ